MATDAFGRTIKPKSDMYTFMLVVSFILFVTSLVLVWVWLHSSYDSGFPKLHGVTLRQETEHQEKAIKDHIRMMRRLGHYPEDGEDFDYEEENGLPRFNDNLTDEVMLVDVLGKYAPEVSDETFKAWSSNPNYGEGQPSPADEEEEEEDDADVDEEADPDVEAEE